VLDGLAEDLLLEADVPDVHAASALAGSLDQHLRKRLPSASSYCSPSISAQPSRESAWGSPGDSLQGAVQRLDRAGRITQRDQAPAFSM
jgi:hypothetical protein